MCYNPVKVPTDLGLDQARYEDKPPLQEAERGEEQPVPQTEEVTAAMVAMKAVVGADESGSEL